MLHFVIVTVTANADGSQSIRRRIASLDQCVEHAVTNWSAAGDWAAFLRPTLASKGLGGCYDGPDYGSPLRYDRIVAFGEVESLAEAVADGGGEVSSSGRLIG